MNPIAAPALRLYIGAECGCTIEMQISLWWIASLISDSIFLILSDTIKDNS